MPYIQTYVPAPVDESVVVLKEIPESILSMKDQELAVKNREFKNVTAIVDNKLVKYYYCRHCGGWIEGQANEYEIDDIGPLCGRRGTEYYCRRCGEEIGFFGMMS